MVAPSAKREKQNGFAFAFYAKPLCSTWRFQARLEDLYFIHRIGIRYEFLGERHELRCHSDFCTPHRPSFAYFANQMQHAHRAGQLLACQQRPPPFAALSHHAAPLLICFAR
jgi:hypothetical protein